MYGGFISASVTTIAWSEIPGAFAVYLINDGFVVNSKSNGFSSLVGSLCICERLKSDIISIKCCCSFQSCVVLECFRHSLSQSMSGQLKSPHKTKSFGFDLLLFLKTLAEMTRGRNDSPQKMTETTHLPRVGVKSHGRATLPCRT